jgi:hypothetical protein
MEGCHEPVGGVGSIQLISLHDLSVGGLSFSTYVRLTFSLFSSTILSTLFYWIETSWVEAVVVVLNFCSMSDWIVKRDKFVV